MEVEDVNLVLSYLTSQCESDSMSIEISERGQRALDRFREMTIGSNSTTESSHVDQALLKRQSGVIIQLVHQLQDHTATHNKDKARQLNETLNVVQDFRREDRPDIRSLLLRLIKTNESQLNGGWAPFSLVLDQIDAQLSDLEKILLGKA
jgi:hypothetical protein